MPTHRRERVLKSLRRFYFLILFAVCIAPATAQVAANNFFYARVNSFGIFAAYSGDSSHMLLGYAENRKLLNFGFSYARRLFMNRIVNWQYNGEVLPVALESDPVASILDNQTSPSMGTYTTTYGPVVDCAPETAPYSVSVPGGVIYSGTESIYCSGHRWTVGEGFSPVGFQWNFRTRHRLQPFFIGHGGYMYSTQPIPVAQAGSFNFTFDLGAGFELYHSQNKSVRAEYRYHHISNHGTALLNPGIDNGLFQVTYVFGH